MIGVIIPAHNEEALIAQCLAAVLEAARSPALLGEHVRIVVALDRCTDGTAAIVDGFGIDRVTLLEGNVGLARAAAANHAIKLGARWLATTDADTIVPADWLSGQLAYGCDAFCGIVKVDNWDDYATGMEQIFMGRESPGVNHPHVHGANMGISVETYLRCGGFQALAVSEDVALVSALVAVGASVARQPAPAVVTSTRRHARAQGGFSDLLQDLERRLLHPTPASPPLDGALPG